MAGTIRALVAEARWRGVWGTVRAMKMNKMGTMHCFVYKDQFGNKYFEDKSESYGRHRWVEYSEDRNFDSLKIPPDWHAWLHHNTDVVPTKRPLPKPDYQKEATGNPTGTSDAYVPPHHRLSRHHIGLAKEKYEQWGRDALDDAFGDVTNPESADLLYEDSLPSTDFQPPDQGSTFTWRGVLAHLGPAFLVSIGYLDPGNWATDIEGGSRFGYQLLWVLVLANAVALLLQVLAARMGIVTRAHLAELCREEYPRPATFLLWVMAELAIIATDLTEVLGTAIGINLLFGIPLMLGVVLTALDTFLLLAAQSQGMRRVEQIIFVFLGVISFCFIAELFMSRADPVQVAKGVLVPRIGPQSLYVATGIVGATVMPHNFYLHSALVIERVPDRRYETLRSQCRYTLVDTAIALNAALFINCSILIIAAAQFWTRGVEVTTLTKAYHLLENTGLKIGKLDLAPVLFGVALIASGQSSTLCGTLAGQYVMEGFLDFTAPPVVRRFITRLVAIVPALIVISVMGDSGTYQLLIMCQVILSLQLPFAVVPMIRFTSSKRRMGVFQNSRLVRTLAWSAAGVVVCLNMAYVAHLFLQGIRSSNMSVKVCTLVLGIPLALGLLAFLLWIAVRAERGGSAVVYRLEDEFDLDMEGLELDSLGSPLGSEAGATPLFSAKNPGEIASPFKLDEVVDGVNTPEASEVRGETISEGEILGS